VYTVRRERKDPLEGEWMNVPTAVILIFACGAIASGLGLAMGSITTAASLGLLSAGIGGVGSLVLGTIKGV